MDRRRIILLAIAVVGVIALADVFVNGVGIFEQQLFGFTFYDEESHPTAVFTSEASYPAADVDKLVLRDEVGTLILQADDVDTVSIEAEVSVYARDQAAALRFIEEARLELPVQDGALMPRISGPTVAGVRRTEVSWTITTPRDMEIDVDFQWGIIELSGVAAPVKATAKGTIEVRDVQGPVQLNSSVGMAVVQGVTGDVQVETSLGSAQVSHVTGDLFVQNSAGEVSVKDVTGSVTFAGSMGEFVGTGIAGNFSGRQEMGEMKVTDVTGQIDVYVRMGDAVVEPAAAAPISATVSQGALTLVLAEELLDQYRFDLQSERLSVPEGFVTREQAQDGHLVHVRVPTGNLTVQTK